MPASRLSVILFASVLPAAISPANAGCSDRPGTPNELKAEPLPSAPNTTIRFSWRNTTSRAHVGDHRMYFDITVRDGKGNDVGKGLTGTGPFTVSYGSRSHIDFPRLYTPQTLCFYIRARTEGGTQGCISKIAAGPVCATTVASKPIKTTRPEKPIKHNGGTSGPHIIVRRESGNVFRVMGTMLRRNVPVAIRVVDARTLMGPIITTVGGRAINSGVHGIFEVRLYGLCTKAKGPLSFSLNDGRENKADKTGTLWSNTVTQACL